MTKLFLTALSIRWAYALAMFAYMGDAGLQTLDSTTYIANAISGHNDPATMPTFAWWLRNYAYIFGNHLALPFVLSQGIVDAFSCVMICAVSNKFAGYAAAFNPTQIIIAGLVLTDTLFIFYVILFLGSVMLWLEKEEWWPTFGIATGLFGAIFTRAMIVPYAIFVIPFLYLMRPQFKQCATIGIFVLLALAIIENRNLQRYDTLALTSQTGMHLAYNVVPLVRETKDGIPAHYNSFTVFSNPFEESARLEEQAWKELKALGPMAIGQAWIKGMIANLVTPAIVISPAFAALPHTPWSATGPPKIYNFLTQNGIYSWLLIMAIPLVMMIRLFQLEGFMTIKGPIALLFLSWIIYVLLITGPVTSPKYRLPIEPVLMICMGLFMKKRTTSAFRIDHYPRTQ